MADTTARLATRLINRGLEAGLAAVGIAAATVQEPARTVLHLRKSEGLHGSMNFTYRNPDRSTDPTRSLPTAQAIVTGAFDYRRADGEPPAAPSGRVARYAWRDHYTTLRDLLRPLATELDAAGWQTRTHIDDNSVVDRNAAYSAGLGWYGKNANLLLPDAGSWYVLGSVITDAPLPPTGPPQADGCGSCHACFDGCPTGAIIGPGVVDARRCLAWLVQGPGPIPVAFRSAVGDRLYGCDDCQDVCPPNRASDRRLAPPAAEPDSDPWIDLEWLLTADDRPLMERVGRWYIADRDPDIVRRTALVVLGNVADPSDPSTEALVTSYLAHRRPLLRAHAVWAARRLGRPDWLGAVAHDPDPDVRAELEGEVEARLR